MACGTMKRLAKHAQLHSCIARRRRLLGVALSFCLASHSPARSSKSGHDPCERSVGSTRTHGVIRAVRRLDTGTWRNPCGP
eukprot:8245541-Pyramimonas_sp.AAC.1